MTLAEPTCLPDSSVNTALSPSLQPVKADQEWNLICKWDVQCRSLLVNIETHLGKWIAAENEFRRSLSSSAAKDFQLTDVGYT